MKSIYADCKHPSFTESEPRSFFGPVSRDENPHAWGSITVTHTCEVCGATRRQNRNQGAVETGDWVRTGGVSWSGFDAGDRVRTPGGAGTVRYRRMAPPSFTEVDAYLVCLDARIRDWAYSGTIYKAAEVTALDAVAVPS